MHCKVEKNSVDPINIIVPTTLSSDELCSVDSAPKSHFHPPETGDYIKSHVYPCTIVQYNIRFEINSTSTLANMQF